MANWTRPIGRTVIVALLLLVAITACAGRQDMALAPLEAAAAPATTPNPPGPTAIQPTATPGPQVAAAAAAASAASPPPTEAILQDALDALAGVDAWHVDLDLPLTARFRGLTFQLPVTYAGDFRAPNHLEGTLALQLLGLKVEKDTVLLAKQIEVTGDGSSQPAASAQPVSIVSLLGFAGLEAADIENLRLVGEESLDGTPVYHLKGNVPLQGMKVAAAGVELRGEFHFDLWTGVDDALPRQASGKAELAATRGQGNLQLSGTATFSAYGRPLAATAPRQPVTVFGGVACGGAGDGFVAYVDEAAATRFCYPSTWVVDDVVESCGPFVVSPTGVASGNPIPASMVLVYPDRTIARFGESAAGAVGVSGRTTLCFFQLVSNAASKGKTASTLDLAREMATLLARVALNKGSLVSLVAGIQSGDAKAVAASYILDEEADRVTIEAIIDSIVPGKGVAR